MIRDGASGSNLGVPSASEVGEEGHEDPDPVHHQLKARWAELESNIAELFGPEAQTKRAQRRAASAAHSNLAATAHEIAKTSTPPKKAARLIDEDDYGDDDDEEGDEPVKESPVQAKSKSAGLNGLLATAIRSPAPTHLSVPPRAPASSSSEQAKSSEDVRKQLDEDKKAAAEEAKRKFQGMFFTFENDRDAMLEQQKLDDLEREVDNEMAGGANGNPTAQQGSATTNTQGTLGSADLGASSLTLKHLIARIDLKRDMVKTSDTHLRALISEVKKGRSKWASEDRVGQEELYEAAEKVLMELKALTEYVQPFLTRVSKREAPDYHNVIKYPMDIGTVSKKLRGTAYKSKREFVDDLNLIWSNCLKYNQDPAHPLRKKALYMRKETDKLTPLIPDVTVRDRAEVEAEERKQQAHEADDSDEDDAPLMASRGRKAPKKGGKGLPTSTKRAPALAVDDPSSTPAPDVKPLLNHVGTHLRNDFLRADSEAHDASSAGFGTPPPGNATPLLGINGVHGSGAPGSQADVMEIDGIGASILSTTEDVDEDDTEFKAWKQVTKKDRAQAAAERKRLFRGEQLKNLNVEEPALLRTKAMMRRWLRQQKMAPSDRSSHGEGLQHGSDGPEQAAQGESLAEGIEKDEDSTLPDYYTSLSAIPEVDDRLKWITDSEGYVVPQADTWMRMYPKEQFKSTQGSLTTRIEANMRQMQETRKVCSKIGIVKQMQIQAQVCIVASVHLR